MYLPLEKLIQGGDASARPQQQGAAPAVVDTSPPPPEPQRSRDGFRSRDRDAGR